MSPHARAFSSCISFSSAAKKLGGRGRRLSAGEADMIEMDQEIREIRAWDESAASEIGGQRRRSFGRDVGAGTNHPASNRDCLFPFLTLASFANASRRAA